MRRLPEIWAIRRAVHEQMALLWKREPMVDVLQHHEWRVREIKNIRTIPLVTDDAHLRAYISIKMLREDSDGGVVNNTGDLDNRLKTLLDGLRGPVENDQGFVPADLPDPLYCLLEDDRLISGFSVETGPLLMPPLKQTPDPAAWVNVVIDVDVNPIRTGWQLLPP